MPGENFLQHIRALDVGVCVWLHVWLCEHFHIINTFFFFFHSDFNITRNVLLSELEIGVQQCQRSDVEAKVEKIESERVAALATLNAHA